MAVENRADFREFLFAADGPFRPVDLHLHSSFTDAAMRLDEALAAALERDLEAIAFTDHARANSDYIPRYLMTIDGLRGTAPIPIYAGLEVKITNYDGGLDLPMCAGLDLILASIHRFPDGNGGYYRPSEITAADAAAIEMRATLGVLGAGTADVIAHPTRTYYMHYDEPFPREYLLTMARAAAASGIPLELNARDPGWPRIREICREAAAKVSLGSDAHELGEVGKMWRIVGADGADE